MEVEVTPETTMKQIKDSHELVGYVLSFKGHRKNIESVADIGIQAGETISVVKTGLTPEQKAAWRLKSGRSQKTNAHSHLHAQTQATVVGAVMEESELSRTTIKEEGELTRSAVTEEGVLIRNEIGILSAISRGETSSRILPGQTKRDRRSQLRI